MARILVVDDVPEIAQMWVMMLHQGGHITVPASSGPEAVAVHHQALHSERPFDLLLLDLAMPGMNGFQAADQIRKAEPGAKIVFITAYDEPMSVGRASGIDAPVWAKPMTQSELLDRVEEVLNVQCLP